MRIAIISEVFFPNIGGMEIRYKELGRTLVKMGHQVEVYTLRLNVAHPIQDIIDGVIVHRITNAFQYFTSFWGLRNYPDVIFFTLALLNRKKELESFDFIIFNKWPVIPAIMLPSFIRNKFIIDWCEIYNNSNFWNVIYHLMTFRKNILHTSVNQRICDNLQSRYLISSKRTKAILSGIKPDIFACKQDDKQNKSILFLGRLTKHKDPEFVIKAFLKNALDEKGYKLNIVGNGPLYEDLKKRYDNKYGISIQGYVDDLGKSTFLKQASLLVLTSKREGFPVVCAEAAAAGTPTLTILNPDNGTVNVVTQFGIGWIANVNLDELADKIERYGNKDYWEWASVSQRCVQQANKVFEWSIVAKELLNFANTSI